MQRAKQEQPPAVQGFKTGVDLFSDVSWYGGRCWLPCRQLPYWVTGPVHDFSQPRHALAHLLTALQRCPMMHCLHVLATALPADTRACLQEQRERARQRASRFGTTDTLDAKVESLRQAQGERQRKRDRAERFNMEVEADDETGQEDAGLLFRGVRQGDHGVEGREPAATCAVASCN